MDHTRTGKGAVIEHVTEIRIGNPFHPPKPNEWGVIVDGNYLGGVKLTRDQATYIAWDISCTWLEKKLPQTPILIIDPGETLNQVIELMELEEAISVDSFNDDPWISGIRLEPTSAIAGADKDKPLKVVFCQALDIIEALSEDRRDGEELTPEMQALDALLKEQIWPPSS
jgi:hypothetical protein